MYKYKNGLFMLNCRSGYGASAPSPTYGLQSGRFEVSLFFYPCVFAVSFLVFSLRPLRLCGE